MFSAIRSAASTRVSARVCDFLHPNTNIELGLTKKYVQAFSTTSSRAVDMAKLTLIGRLGRDPEVRTTKTDREYVSYAQITSVKPTNALTNVTESP